jgi:two-component system, cell cycle sensor histidine kinase PleC
MTSNVMPNLRDWPARASLDDEPHAAVIIDAAAAMLLAANDQGRALLGLEGDEPLPYPLDCAMPALARLRHFARDSNEGERHETLTFWSAGRTRRVDCDVSRLANGSDGGPVFAIRCTPYIAGTAANGTNGHHTIPAIQSRTDDEPSPPRIERNDMDTLKEIARRIREGQISGGGYPEAEPLSAAAAPDRDNPSVVAAAPIALRPRPAPRALAPGELSKLAHELKTPLTAIAAASEIMRDERLGAMGNTKYLGYAADIHDSATHALAVIATMLTEPADADDELAADIDLNDLVARALSPMQPIATERGLTLVFEPEDGTPSVRGNATAVRQILLNLVTNALKFTPRGGDVRAVTGYLPDGAAFMVVRDTGIGISDDDVADDDAEGDIDIMPRARPGGGLGLGLPLVRRLAAGMGANVEIDSMPGKGTVVLIAFPRAGGTP